MQRFLIILFLIFGYNLQAAKAEDFVKKVDSHPTVVDTLHQSTSSPTINSIEQQNALLNTALNVNSNLFGGISTYFTVVSILLTIIVVILPLVNYFFVLKPSEKAMKKVAGLESELLEKIETNFEEYMVKIEHKKAKVLIRALATGPDALIPFVNFFFLREYSDFDDEDQNIMIDFLEKQYEVDHLNLISLHIKLGSRPSRSCEAYYKKIIETADKKNWDFALQYLINNEPEKNINFFEVNIVQSPDGHKILSQIVDYIQEEYIGSRLTNLTVSEKRKLGEEKFRLFMDNERICDSVENKELHMGHKRINFALFPENKFIKDTYYYKKYNQRN
jgi:hypothetical protein